MSRKRIIFESSKLSESESGIEAFRNDKNECFIQMIDTEYDIPMFVCLDEETLSEFMDHLGDILSEIYNRRQK